LPDPHANTVAFPSPPPAGRAPRQDGPGQLIPITSVAEISDEMMRRWTDPLAMGAESFAPWVQLVYKDILICRFVDAGVEVPDGFFHSIVPLRPRDVSAIRSQIRWSLLRGR